eukprot:4559515-Alexandrium_andersonii.AAC.1
MPVGAQRLQRFKGCGPGCRRPWPGEARRWPGHRVPGPAKQANMFCYCRAASGPQSNILQHESMRTHRQ